MTQNLLCPVCRATTGRNSMPLADISVINCPRCGEYSITRTLGRMLSMQDDISQNKFTTRQRAVASNLLRQYSNLDFVLTTENYKTFFEARDIPILEKVDKLLLWVESQVAGDYGFNTLVNVDLGNYALYAACWAIDSNQLGEVFSLLQERGFVEQPEDCEPYYVKITATGWDHLEQLRIPNRDSTQGFVAMWFHRKMEPLYNLSLEKAIIDAGYHPHRVDKREHAEKIDDEIIMQIRRSRFVVADLTGHRGGVYYEAGFAHGLGLPVFLTCRADKKLHFDVRQYNCIFWEWDKLDEFKTALTRRIEATLGKGPR